MTNRAIFIDGPETTEAECWTEALAQVQAEEETDRQTQAQARTLDDSRITLDADKETQAQAQAQAVDGICSQSKCRLVCEDGGLSAAGARSGPGKWCWLRSFGEAEDWSERTFVAATESQIEGASEMACAGELESHLVVQPMERSEDQSENELEDAFANEFENALEIEFENESVTESEIEFENRSIFAFIIRFISRLESSLVAASIAAADARTIGKCIGSSIESAMLKVIETIAQLSIGLAIGSSIGSSVGSCISLIAAWLMRSSVGFFVNG